MLGNIKHWDIEEFENNRVYLLLNAAGLKRIITAFRKKYGIRPSQPTLAKKFLFRESVVKSELYSKLSSLAKELRITNQLMEDILSNWLEHRHALDIVSLPLYTSIGDPLPDGHYIKVSPYTRLNTVKKTYEYIKTLYKNEYKIADKVDFKNKKVSERDKDFEGFDKKVKLYIQIEKTIYKKLKESADISGIFNIDKLVIDSIEFAAEEWLNYGKSAPTKEEIKGCKDIYYKLQTHFEIPSYKEFQELQIRMGL